MPEWFQFDVCLSRGAKEQQVVCELAAGLQQNGLCIWLDEEQIKADHSVLANIEEGLEYAYKPQLWMSSNPFASERPSGN